MAKIPVILSKINNDGKAIMKGELNLSFNYKTFINFLSLISF